MDELLTPFPVKTFPLFLSASHFEVAKTLMLYAKIKTNLLILREIQIKLLSLV